MLLARHPSLGRLPAALVLGALAAVVIALACVLVQVLGSAPVLLVPDATGVVRAAPARADTAYVDAFVRGFLEDWASWTPYTVRPRRERALARLAPGARAALGPASERCAPLLESLQQSQSLRIDALAITDLGDGRFAVRVRGRLASYFGGVGGAPDPIEGEVGLSTVRATAQAPRCLEVTGVRLCLCRDRSGRPNRPDRPDRLELGGHPAPITAATVADPIAAADQCGGPPAGGP